jgi:hypothetical protein
MPVNFVAGTTDFEFVKIADRQWFETRENGLLGDGLQQTIALQAANESIFTRGNSKQCDYFP